VYNSKTRKVRKEETERGVGEEDELGDQLKNRRWVGDNHFAFLRYDHYCN
jgi:hypothetical protein